MVKDVHTEHCCVVHGCAYYVSFCPVALKLKNQSFPCPFCLGVMPELPFKISEPLLREDIWDQLTGIDRLAKDYHEADTKDVKEEIYAIVAIVSNYNSVQMAVFCQQVCSHCPTLLLSIMSLTILSNRIVTHLTKK